MKKTLLAITMLALGVLVQAQTIMPVPFLSRISGGDTTPNYLLNKLVAGAGVTLTKNNPGANETITITSASGSFSTTTINGVATTTFTFSTSTTGTDFNVSTTTNTIIFNLPTASVSNRGALSPTDWSTFNNKVSNAYASSTFPSFSYASSTYYFASNPSNYITLASLSATYPIQYNSSTGVISTGFSTSTINSFSAKQTFTNASSTSFTADTLYSTTGIFGSGAFSSTLNVTGKTTLANASSTSLTVSGLSYLATTTVTGDVTVSGNIPNRVVGYTASSTITINVDTTDEATTTVNQTTTFANPTGTPIDGFMYMLTLTATGTRTIAWGTNFASSTDLNAPLTIASGTTEVLWKYDGYKLKYLLLGVLKTFE